jgi:Peptidase M60, enhancin and enhancin-like/Ricin-type beta-trefoil lectin domain-like/N-terminal domain of M60-like peptidases
MNGWKMLARLYAVPALAATLSMIPADSGAAKKPAANLAEGDYYIVSTLSHKVLTAQSARDGTIEIVQWQKNAGRDGDQIWTLKKDREGNQLYCRKRGQYLAASSSQDARTPVVLRPASAGGEQTWRLEPYGNAYRLIAQHSGMNMAVHGFSMSNGAPIVQMPADSLEAEQWLLYRADQVTPNLVARRPDNAIASTYDNATKTYRIAPLPSASAEAERTNRLKLADYQPSGLFVKQGEIVSIETRGAPSDTDGLVIAIGPMAPFFGADANGKPFLLRAQDGSNQFTAPYSGMMYFRYVDNGLLDAPRPAIDVHVTRGGTAVPLYVQGVTTPDQWKRMLIRYPRAPWVEISGRRAMISVRRSAYDRSARNDPAVIFPILDAIISHQDRISGLDGATEADRPSPLRLHYIQDDVTPKKALHNVYMYAVDYYIGMPGKSASDLLDPQALKQAWSIWHETGHLYQQSDWTWDSVVETTVNIYSLYTQERLGLRSRLAEEVEPGGRSPFDDARRYLASAGRDFTDDSTFPTDSEPVWVRLVMYEQLRRGLGEAFYEKLHQYYRLHPLTYEQQIGDHEKIQAFIYRSCLVADLDLTDFFSKWGLRANAATLAAVRSLQYPRASRDLTTIDLERAANEI